MTRQELINQIWEVKENIKIVHNNKKYHWLPRLANHLDTLIKRLELGE